MPKATRTVATQPGEETAFIRKAQSSLEDAKALLKQGSFNSAAILAIHATISSCDAVTAKFLNCRHKGDNHLDVIRLLKGLPIKDPDELSKRTKQVTDVLERKTETEYESRSIQQQDATTMVTQAGRVYKWAKSLVD